MSAPAETSPVITQVGRIEDEPSGRALIASVVARGESKVIRLEERRADGETRRLIDVHRSKLRGLIALLELADAQCKPRPSPGVVPTFGSRPDFGGHR